MVTTRSGIPLKPNAAPSGLKARSKPAATIFIFEENNTESKKRESPCKTVKKEAKKSKTHIVLPDKENAINVPVNQLPSSSLQSDTKKIKISQDEKLMNGAPEGDLFDMVVFEDSELWPYTNDAEAHDELAKCYKIHQESTVWADQYESVVVMRRVVLFHSAVVNNDRTALSQVVSSTIAGVESLRSCRVRSGIMGLRGILKFCSNSLCAPVSGSSSAATVDHCAALINSLLVKTGGGPKFICELASSILFQEAVANVPPLTLIRCLLPFVPHRNPELSGNAIQAIVESSRKIQSELMLNPSEDSMVHLRDLMQALAQGISAKKPSAKESAKSALKCLAAQVGDTHLRNLLQMHVSESQMGDVLRLVAAGSSSAAVGASSSSSAPAGCAACTPSPLVARAGLDKTFSRGVPSGGSALHASSVPSKFARMPLQPPSSATGGATSSVSKFKMHLLAQSVDRSAADVVCAAPLPRSTTVIETPSRTVGPVPPSASSAVSVAVAPAVSSVPATPVLSVRDHIMLMKQQKRLQASQSRPESGSEGTLVLPATAAQLCEVPVLVVERSVGRISVTAASTGETPVHRGADASTSDVAVMQIATEVDVSVGACDEQKLER